MKKNIYKTLAFIVASFLLIGNADVFANTCEYCGMKAVEETDKDTYDFYYNTVGGSNIDKTTVNKDKLPVNKTTSKDGYKFNGWYKGLSKYDFNEKINGDTVIRAGFSKMCTATFYDDENSKPIVEEFVCGNTPNAHEPLKENNIFVGWTKSNGEKYDGGDLYFDEKLTAVWKEADKVPEDYKLVAPVINEIESHTNDGAIVENGLKWATLRKFKIDFKNNDIVNDINFYIKTTGNAISNVKVYECGDSKDSCTDTLTNEIYANKWYKVGYRKITLVFGSEANVVAVVEYKDSKQTASAEVKYVDALKPVVHSLNIKKDSFDGEEYQGDATKSTLYFEYISADKDSGIASVQILENSIWKDFPDTWETSYKNYNTTMTFKIWWDTDTTLVLRSVDKAGNVSDSISKAIKIAKKSACDIDKYSKDCYCELNSESDECKNYDTICNINQWSKACQCKLDRNADTCTEHQNICTNHPESEACFCAHDKNSPECANAAGSGIFPVPYTKTWWCALDSSSDECKYYDDDNFCNLGLNMWTRGCQCKLNKDSDTCTDYANTCKNHPESTACYCTLDKGAPLCSYGLNNADDALNPIPYTKRWVCTLNPDSNNCTDYQNICVNYPTSEECGKLTELTNADYEVPQNSAETPTPTKTDISTCQITGIPTYDYDGAVHQPLAITVTCNNNTTVLKDTVDYTVDYSGLNLAGPGAVTPTVNGIGNYTGSKQFTYYINKSTSSSSSNNNNNNNNNNNSGSLTSNNKAGKVCYYVTSYDESMDRETCLDVPVDGWWQDGGKICYYATTGDEENDRATCLP